MLNRPIQFGVKNSSRANCSDGSAAFGLFSIQLGGLRDQTLPDGRKAVEETCQPCDKNSLFSPTCTGAL